MNPMNQGVGAIITEDRKILLLLRKTSPEKGRWGFPGGKVEAGEDLEAAIKREVAEEVGLKVTKVELVDSFTYRVVFDNFIGISNVFKVAIEGSAINVEKSIHDKMSWFDVNELPKNIAIPVRRVLLKLLEGTLENIDE